MRTNIDIEDTLMADAMRATGLSTKRDTVMEGLRVLVEQRRQTEALERLWGIGWEGDLDEMRRSW